MDTDTVWTQTRYMDTDTVWTQTRYMDTDTVWTQTRYMDTDTDSGHRHMWTLDLGTCQDLSDSVLSSLADFQLAHSFIVTLISQ